MCERTESLVGIIRNLKAKISWVEKDDEFGFRTISDIKMPEFSEIVEITDNCPACTLAILRLAGLNKGSFYYEEFNYNEMKQTWWRIINDEELQRY